ncbi:MAG: AarF/UbiB family protein [Myxococcaceae bacterium]
MAGRRDDEPEDEEGGFGEALRSQERAVPTGRLGRWWNSGRSAVGLASTVLRGRDVMPDRAALEALTGRLGELKGVGMKLGQILSFIDPSLPPEAREVLSVLQRNAAASPFPAVEGVLRDAFGARADQLLATLERKPFSVASIGQVHRARLGEREVVVKVRHPGIEQALKADFSAAVGGVSMANAVLFGLASSAKAMVDECRATLLSECDFAREASSQRTFGAWAAGHRVLVVPEVVDAWSSGAVLTTRYEPGASLEAFLAGQPTQAARDAAGVALFEVMVRGFHELGLLYADPHPGNFAFRTGPDGAVRVVLYDFGCVRAYEARHTRAFSALVAALREGRRADALQAARDFGFGVEGAEREAIFDRFARSFFAPLLERGASVVEPDGAVEASQVLKDKRALAKLGLPPHLLFLLRLRFGMYAVLARLGARADWGALESEWSCGPISLSS